MNFYTVNLIIPAVVGLPIFISMFANQDMRISQFLLAVMICFWMTIFIEKWKRKENELRFTWGVSHFNKEDESKIRSEFLGNEELSHSNYRVNKKNMYKWGGTIAWLLNAITILALSVCKYYSFVETKKSLMWGGLFQRLYYIELGMANSVYIFIFNKVYKKIYFYISRLDNHKYEKDYISAFIKNLGIMSIINQNLSVIHTIYLDRSLKQVNELLIGMTMMNIFI